MLKHQNHQNRFVRITVCGAKGSGKTSLIEQLVYGIPPQRKAQQTIEDIYCCYVETERNMREKVRWRFEPIMKSAYLIICSSRLNSE